MDCHNMIAGSQLAEPGVDPKAVLSSAGDVLPKAGNEAGFLVGLIMKLRAAIEVRVPVGYQDKTGFHYGANATDWFFTI